MDARSPRASSPTRDDPFGRHALGYASVWGQDPVARLQREEVWALLDRVLPPGGRVLDAGCGVGLDAARLAERGHEVVGIDASPGMIAEAARRTPGLTLRVLAADDPEGLAALGRFDAALLDFGVVNCLDLPRAARGLGAALRPGAPLVLVTMPRLNPTWTLQALAARQPRRALARLRAELDVPVEGGAVRTRYLGSRAVMRAFSPWFALEERAALGLLLPPPGTRWPPERLARLASLEGRVRRWPLLRELGDHLLLLLRRRVG